MRGRRSACAAPQSAYGGGVPPLDAAVRRSAGITCTRRSSSMPCAAPSAPPALPSARDLPLRRHAPAGGRQRHPDRPGAARPQGRRHNDDLHPRLEPRSGRRPELGQSITRGRMMRTQARPTPSLSWHASRRISRTRGTLRRSRGLFQTTRQTADRPSRGVRGIYAGLSNTRYAFQRRGFLNASR